MGMLELGVTFSFIQLLIDDMLVDGIKNIIGADYGIHKIADPEWPACLVGKGFPADIRWLHRDKGQRFGRGNGDHSFWCSDIAVKARQKVEAILHYHKPEPLPPLVRDKIREIILEVEERKVRG